MNKATKIGLYVILGINVVLSVLYYMFGTEEGTLECDSWTQNYLTWAYILFGLSLLAVIALPFVTIKQRKFNLKKIGITIATIVIVVVISLALASSNDVILADGSLSGTAPGTLKLVDTSLILTYILLVAAFLSIVGGAIYNKVKK